MATQASAVASLKLTVANPEGKTRIVEVDRSPFQIGRRNDCELSLADNRISRTHAQILLEDGKYVLEDLESRHGTFVNGEKISRHDLLSGDRIAFGFDDSYTLLIGTPSESAPRLMRKVEALPAPGATGNLGRLSAVLEVALALQSSRSVQDVLGAAVDAALSLTGAERGFLLLRSGGPDSELEVRVARNQNGEDLDKQDLRIPRNVLRQALDRRLDLLSMTIDPLKDSDTGSTDQTVLALNLRSVLCVPLVKIRMGREHETSMLSARVTSRDFAASSGSRRTASAGGNGSGRSSGFGSRPQKASSSWTSRLSRPRSRWSRRRRGTGPTPSRSSRGRCGSTGATPRGVPWTSPSYPTPTPAPWRSPGRWSRSLGGAARDPV
jgi:hypothetical protein